MRNSKKWMCINGLKTSNQPIKTLWSKSIMIMVIIISVPIAVLVYKAYRKWPVEIDALFILIYTLIGHVNT